MPHLGTRLSHRSQSFPAAGSNCTTVSDAIGTPPGSSHNPNTPEVSALFLSCMLAGVAVVTPGCSTADRLSNRISYLLSLK